MVTKFTTGAIAALLAFGLTRGAAAQSSFDLDIANGGSDQAWLGTAASSIAGWWMDQGDLNGDARKDLIVGAPGASTGTGHVYVIFGGPVRTGDNLLSSANIVLNGGSGGDRFGTATAAGHIRRTGGARDLLVGAPSSDSNKGRVYLYAAPFSSGAVLNTSAAVLTVIGRAGDRIGTALGTADLNGDGYRDLVIGAGGSQKVYVIYGGPTVSGTIDLSVTAPATEIRGESIGHYVAAGDVTADGIYDLVLGAPLAANAAGRVYLVTGRVGALPATIDLDTQAAAVFSGRNPGDNAGSAVSLGDFDQDLTTDILIGAPGGDANSTRGNAGDVYVLWGRQTFTSMSLASADVTIYGAAMNHYAGTRLDAGDINRDAPNDIVILSAGARDNNGHIYVIYGRRRSSFPRTIDLATTYDRSVFNSADEGQIGNTAVFEVTGEGARDIVVAYPWATAGSHAQGGKVYMALSPKLKPFPTAPSVSVGAGQTKTFTLEVRNPGTGTVPWKAESMTSWVTVSPADGSSTPVVAGTFQCTVSAANLGTGTHHASVKVTSLTDHLEMFVTVPISVTVTVPVSRISDVDGDGIPESTPPTPRYLIGLGALPGAGGWFEVHAGSDLQYGVAAWARQPWMPYNHASGEVYPALGDVDGDGRAEVVLGFGPAMGGWLLVLDDDENDYAILKWIKLDWGAYTSANGVLYPAVGDIDGDGRAEIVVGLGSGGAGWYRIYDDASTGFAPLKWGRVAWDLYNTSRSGETHPAVGDVDGDGMSEIILGLGHGGGGWVQVVSSAADNYAHRAWTKVSDDAYNAGPGATWPAAGDIDGDGRAEIVLGLGRGGGGRAEVKNDATQNYAHVRWLRTGWSTYDDANGELHPAVGNLDGDAAAEIILGLGPFANGGWYILLDDGGTANALIRWKQVQWGAYNASGGPTWPAIGRLR